MRFLLFTLYAPMASFGEIAVGERRMSWARPGRSAILGLVAAAQGIERADDDAHARLEAGLHFAVRTDAPGRPLIDYHTTQTPRARKGRSYATRREELDASGLNTVLSSREWRADSCFTVVLWPRTDQSVDLDLMAESLRHPRFVLYVGRKSAPLGLPLNPAIVEANSFFSALEIRRPNDAEQEILIRTRIDGLAGGEIAFDHDAPVPPCHTRLERRRDAVVSRVRWQFADRFERVIVSAHRED